MNYKPPLLYTAQEAADKLGIAVTTMRIHLQQGNLPAKKLGRDWVISKASLDWFQENRRGAGRPKGTSQV